MTHYRDNDQRTAYLKWLTELEAGDNFAIMRGGAWRGHTIHTVERVTPAQIVFTTGRVNRTTGRLIGAKSYSSIKPATQEIRDACELDTLTAWLYSVERSGATLAQLRAMRAAHDGAVS